MDLRGGGEGRCGGQETAMAGLETCNGQLSSLTERTTTSLKLIVVDSFMFT